MWDEESDYPEYYYEDPDYQEAQNLSEVRVLRLVKTYHDLVSQRYDNPNPFPYKNFGINPERRQLRLHGKKYFDQLVAIGDRLGDRDPSYFMAFVFDLWSNRDYYHVYKALGWKESPGVQFPSIYRILEQQKELVQEFMARPGYKPSDFIPRDEHRKRRKAAMEGRVQRWCSAFDKTPWDYWANPAHLNPNYLSARDLDYADSFWELNDRFLKEWELSAQDIRDSFEKTERMLDRLRREKYKAFKRQREQGEEVYHKYLKKLPYAAFLDEYTIRKIDYIEACLRAGQNVGTDEFEQEMEDTINPIDFDHPDTVMYFHYGVGDKPRRRYDGSTSGE